MGSYGYTLAHCSSSPFQSYRFSSKTERFFFERVIPRKLEKILWPSPAVYTTFLTHAVVCSVKSTTNAPNTTTTTITAVF
jgi:hypothetical protein